MLTSLSGFTFGLDKDEKEAISAIKSGDISSLQSFMEKHPDVNCSFSNGKTGLYYAILYDQVWISHYLLERGADPELIVDERTTLYWAINYSRDRIARLLIEYGADVNRADEDGNTPLIYAAGLNDFELCKILIDRGANPSHKNKKGRRASDMAMQFSGSHAYGYLLFMEDQYISHDTVPSMHDGPYVFYEDDKAIIITYFERKQDENLTRLVEKTSTRTPDDTLVFEPEQGTGAIVVRDSFPLDPYEEMNVEKIFTIGDIHGHYVALLKLLSNNGIIDSLHNWSFGTGRLVLLGDVFDRGAKVTETLWFVYKLQMQAQAAGGKVHLLLGNHEIMALTGDHRYLNEKYIFFSHYMQFYYSQLYETNTLLGRWLRSRNVILKINGYLFLHAGISPQLAVMGYGFDEVNEKVREYINESHPTELASQADLVLGQFGPLWYRGYGNYGGDAPEVTQEFVDTYMKAKALNRMIVGHNEQTTITTAFNGKVISADVAIDESGESAQGLLIIGDELFRCYADGSKEPLMDD